jgi:hypothetical protein
MLDGSSGILSAEQLDSWLDNVEARTSARIVVIIEACRSGSFIKAPASISKVGRVIITSTSDNKNSFPSAQGAYFSDAFFTALAVNKNLTTSFEQARLAIERVDLNQDPWLDDNGDGVADALDGVSAHAFGLLNLGAEEEPVILDAAVQLTGEITGTISALVRDDVGVDPAGVWAEVFAPSFVEPTPGADFQTPVLAVPRVWLTDPDGDNVYTASYGGMDEPGLYRVVVYAQDTAGNQAVPWAVEIRTGWQVYLPLVARP